MLENTFISPSSWSFGIGHQVNSRMIMHFKKYTVSLLEMQDMRRSLLGIFNPPFYSPHACFLTQVSLISTGQLILVLESHPSTIPVFGTLPPLGKLVNIRNIIGPISESSHYASHIRIRVWIAPRSLLPMWMMQYSRVYSF